MKKTAACLILVWIGFSLAGLAQNNSSERISGTPCKNCNVAERNNPNSTQNGNQTLSTSYTASACGLNYTQGSVRLGQRPMVNGVIQPAPIVISGLPPCYTILKAFLYADASGTGVAINANIINPASTSSLFPMTIIGSGPDKCWSYAGTYSYRADITSIITGNGTYTISGLPTGSTNDVDGATILIIYQDNSQVYTGNMVLADGCHEKNGGTASDTLKGLSACANSSFAQGFSIIADLQKNGNTALQFNYPLPNYTEFAANDDYWNFIQGTANPVTSGQNSFISVATNTADCFNVVAAGLYYRTSCNTCSSSVFPLTIVTSTASSPCAGSATVTASAGTGPYTYTWSPIGITTATIGNTVPGTYTVNIQDATGCGQGSATITITGAPPPTVSITTNGLCSTGSATANVSGGIGPYSYTWTPTGLNTQVINNVGLTTYTVKVKDASACSAVTQTTTIFAAQVPTLTVSTSSACSSIGSATAIVSGGTPPYSYTWQPTGGNSQIAALLAPGSYTAVTRDAIACLFVGKTFTITAPMPTVTATSSPSLICLSQTATLIATGAMTYTWSTGGNTPVTVVAPAASTTYTVVGSSGSLCSDTAIVTLLVSNCTDIWQLNNEQMKASVFPNPGNGEFIFMVTSEENLIMEIYNDQGQLVQCDPVKDVVNRIDISKETAGVYNLRLVKDGITR
ncbi:MAG: T9SS type A sorting domain-containing protein, partial [Bacteroidia bacterium]